MRVVVTTVRDAKVEIKKEVVGAIDKGYLLLIGFTLGDNEYIINKMIDKIINLRIFPDENGKTNLSIKDVGGDILSVSQFTLYADVSGGRRPSFVNAMRPDEATKMYDLFNQNLEKEFGKKIEKGVFGADMDVYSINEGPFTLLLDSKEVVK